MFGLYRKGADWIFGADCEFLTPDYQAGGDNQNHLFIERGPHWNPAHPSTNDEITKRRNFFFLELTSQGTYRRTKMRT